jgi:hypothetical protein
LEWLDPFAVEGDARGLDRGAIPLRPCHKATHRLQDRHAEVGESVFDARRRGRQDGASDEPVALKIAECLREHPLGDVVQLAAQLTKALRSVGFDVSIANGELATVTDAVEKLGGKKPQGLRDFFAANREAFLAPPKASPAHA